MHLHLTALFMHCWKLRESVLDLLEKTTGGRVIFSVCVPGGVKKDIDDETLKEIVDTLNGTKPRSKSLQMYSWKTFQLKTDFAA